MNRTAAAVILILAGSVCITLPAHLEPITTGHDWLFHLANALEYADALERGTIVAHLTPNYFGGLGGINFKYYPPYAYLPVSLQLLAGVPTARAFAVAFTLAFFLSGLGMFAWARRSLAAGPALVAAGVYLIAPYHIEDIYRRFAYAELWGMAALPWVLCLADVAIEGRRRWALPVLALVLAATGLLHTLSGYMAGVALVVYWPLRGGVGLRSLRRLGAALALAAGLGLFYALPAVLDRGEIRMARQFLDPEEYVRRGLDPAHLVRTGGGGPLAVPSPGLCLLVLGAWGSVVLARSRKQPPGAGRLARFAVPAAIVVMVLLTTKIGAAAVRGLPGFAYMQFPWRFLAVASLFLAYAAGAAAASAAGRRVPAVLVALLSVAVGIFAFGNGLPDREHMVSRTDYARLMRSAYWVSDAEDKYCPIGLVDATDRRPGIDRSPRIWMSSGAGTPHLLQHHATTIRFAVEGSGPRWEVILRRSYTSGWTVAAKSGTVALSNDPATGLMRVSGESVEGPVTLRYVGSPAYRVGAWCSLGALLLTVAWIVGGLISARVARRPGRAAR